MEFRAVPWNPKTKALSLGFVVPTYTMLVVDVVLFAIGVVDDQAALWIGLFFALLQ